MRPPILVKRTYGEEYVKSRILLPEKCNATKLYYDKNMFIDPFTIIKKIINLIKKSKENNSRVHLSLKEVIDEFLWFGRDNSGVFSCIIKDGVLLEKRKNNKVKINVINSRNIWFKLYIINNRYG